MDAAAVGVAGEVVAGEPQAGAGQQHVVHPVPPRPAVPPGGALGVEQERPTGGARGEAAQTGRVEIAGAGVPRKRLMTGPA